MNIDLPCPACGFESLEESYGSFVTCDICGWEDDGVQLANPCSKGGANKESLAEVQEKVIKKYPLSVQIAKGYKRGKSWRPLTSEEIERFSKLSQEKSWANQGVVNESEAYWKQDHNK